MEIAWHLYDKDGSESAAIALNHRYQQLVQDATEKIRAGEEKILVALTVEAKMHLFMCFFERFGADETETREQLFRAICQDFDISKQAFNSATQYLNEIMKLRNQQSEHYR